MLGAQTVNVLKELPNLNAKALTDLDQIRMAARREWAHTRSQPSCRATKQNIRRSRVPGQMTFRDSSDHLVLENGPGVVGDCSFRANSPGVRWASRECGSFRQVRTDWQGKEWTPDVDKNGGKAVTNSASTSITRVDRNEPDTSIARFLQVYSSSTSRICQPPKRQDPDIATGSWQRRNRAPA